MTAWTDGRSLILRQTLDRLEATESGIREELARDIGALEITEGDTEAAAQELYRDAWERLSRTVRIEARMLRLLL